MLIPDGGGYSTQELNLEMTRVSLIRTTLQEALAKVETGATLAAIPSMSFGGAATATELEGHAGKAHHSIVTSLAKSIEGLDAYQQNLQRFVDDSLETDETQRVDLTRITTATSCVASPTFEAPDQCAVSPESGDST